MCTIAVIGTLDTKGAEYLYIKNEIERMGCKALIIDAGVFEPVFEPDISNAEVAEAGGSDIKILQENKDRGTAVNIMSRGTAEILKKLYNEGKIKGVISTGGSGGTTIATTAMRTLPAGVPKVMVSTVASGDTRPYVGTSDITMMYSIVDIAGINVLSSKILSNAVFAVCGMVQNEAIPIDNEKPLVAATMFGVTTPCVTKAREYLEQNGYEVIVFHATGVGGQSMEGLIESGFFKGVLDITTTEWCDELVGGVLAAGPNRLEAAGKSGIPQVVSVGALDMVNFGPMDSVPEKFRARNLYRHNATITLMRTTAEENKKLGEIISDKLNMTNSPTALFLPLKGVSMIDAENMDFYGPEEDKELFDAIRSNLDKSKVELIEMDNNINDDDFALAMAKKLIELMNK